MNSSDYHILTNRIADVASEIKTIKADIEALRSLINSINGRINKKLNPEKQEEDIKTDLPFPFGRGGA
jgi:hypothetical protein